MMTWRWLRRFSGLTSIGKRRRFVVAAHRARAGAACRSATARCARGSALSVARTKKYSSSPGSMPSSDKRPLLRPVARARIARFRQRHFAVAEADVLAAAARQRQVQRGAPHHVVVAHGHGDRRALGVGGQHLHHLGRRRHRDQRRLVGRHAQVVARAAPAPEHRLGRGPARAAGADLQLLAVAQFDRRVVRLAVAGAPAHLAVLRRLQVARRRFERRDRGVFRRRDAHDDAASARRRPARPSAPAAAGWRARPRPTPRTAAMRADGDPVVAAANARARHRREAALVQRGRRAPQQALALQLADRRRCAAPARRCCLPVPARRRPASATSWHARGGAGARRPMRPAPARPARRAPTAAGTRAARRPATAGRAGAMRRATGGRRRQRRLAWASIRSIANSAASAISSWSRSAPAPAAMRAEGVAASTCDGAG